MLSLALALSTSFLLAELVGAWVFGSLALFSDAARMFTDATAMAIALASIKIGNRAAYDERTLGYRRFEMLATPLGAVLLILVAGYILYEGALRIIRPEPVDSTGMLITAALGLIVNVIAMRVLEPGKDGSLKVKSARLQVRAHILGSLAVVAGASIIKLTGWTRVDPVVAIAIGLWVLPRTWALLRDTELIPLEEALRRPVLDEVRSAIAAVPGVRGLHDLHLWALAGDDANCTVHVELEDGADGETVRLAVRRLLDERFAVRHATVRTEHTVREHGEAV